ncbi:Bardet-Biedl syndrome 1 protein [Periophthalmus magnuspinnatus]|uniref:Bardet-Biedl syndrome 1 protein n=1 Tax=Periophthalmus magnuspinnatus TaxID=409849 RepID=UPI00145B174F|nr:Bardet-Biedl syndrome 1 protein [Periophthalmus magnuspinnatus]
MVDSGPSPWLEAHSDPVAGLNTLSSCMDLADLSGDGENCLVVADLGSSSSGSLGSGMKLKVFRGTSLVSESSLLDLPSGLVAFFMDLNEPRVPALAVASGPCVYVYKNLRPYFKFTLPGLEVDPLEQEVWQQVRLGQIDTVALKDLLEGIRTKSELPLSQRSLRFLSLEPENMEEFVMMHQGQPIRRQTVITCMGTLKKSTADEDGVSCLVIGTESSEVYVLDPEAFIILAKMCVPAPPVVMDVSGQFDVEFRITVACRDGAVYILRRDYDKPKYCVELSSHCVGLVRVGKTVVVGCSDQTLQGFTQKGKRLWSVPLPAPITSMAPMRLSSRGFSGVLVALASCELRLYQDQWVLNTQRTPEPVTALTFGRYGREDGTVVMATQGGAMLVHILRRTASLQKPEGGGPPGAQSVRLNVPKKSQLFVDQTLREREQGPLMHRAFHRDLLRTRLRTAQAYSRALEASTGPSSEQGPVKLHAAVQGLGPNFRLTLYVVNAAALRPITGLSLCMLYDPALYTVAPPLLRLPLLAPGLTYALQTRVTCTGPALCDVIKVCVLQEGRSAPLLTAHINMPLPEAL